MNCIIKLVKDWHWNKTGWNHTGLSPQMNSVSVGSKRVIESLGNEPGTTSYGIHIMHIHVP